jgi:predicted acyl esterase
MRAAIPFLLALGACAGGAGRVDPESVRPATHEYRIERGTLAMADGTPLAVTWWIPEPRTAGERFPALLEMLPYRKDDDFYARDFPLYDWFARRGFLMVKVDVRGTGGSGGPLPDREYSERELDDAVQVIAALAEDPRTNGRVGMWGISWGGFNAIQVALRQPPALGAILALHSSDDLFHDDVRYVDGVLHLDRYALQIDHGNGLPRTPDYALDSAYFNDRFDARPWIFRYLAEQEDGSFWRENAWRYRRGDLRVPAYLIGGLLDGYRDTPIRALEAGTAEPLKVEIGPWVHAWPDNGTPGPNYEWRERAARWWDHWLRGRDTGLLDEPPLLVFQRESHAPDAALAETPGRWRFESWPVSGDAFDTLRLEAAGALAPQRAVPSDGPAANWRTLRYAPGTGTAAGEWWGEPTGDMAADDARSLTFDAAPVTSRTAILGLPRVSLVVREGAPLAHWAARLEDVAPDGRVSLITGAAMNAAFRHSTLAPERAVAGAQDTIAFDLHFTTWTLAPGHRFRLSVTNAQFPMLWPTPFAMTTAIAIGDSWLVLPLVPPESRFPAPRLPAPTSRSARADVTWLADTAVGPEVHVDPARGETAVTWHTESAWRIAAVRYDTREDERYSVRDAAPDGADFEGTASHTITLPDRVIRVETRIRVQGGRDALEVTATRTVWQDGALVRTRTWHEAIPRRWH